MGRGAGLLPPPSPPPEQREPPAERGVPGPGRPVSAAGGAGGGRAGMEPVPDEEEAEKAAKPWLLLCGRKVSVRLGAAAPLPACLPKEETRSPCGASPAPGHFGGGVFSHISLPVTSLRAPGSAIFGARASRELRRVDRPERLFGVFSAAGAIPAGRGSDAEPVRPGWAAGEEGGGRGSCSGGTPRRIKVWESSGRWIGTGAAGGGREGAPEPGAHPRGAPGAGVAGPRRSGPLM